MKTSLYTILCIVIRCGAVSIAVRALVGAAMHFSADRSHLTAVADWVTLGFSLGLLLVAFLLWVYPGVLARLATGRASGQVFETPLAGDELERIALSVVGVWVALEGLSSLAYSGLFAVVFVNGTGGEGPRLPLPDENVAAIGSYLVQIALGIALSLGSRGLVGVFRRIRQ